MHIPCHATARKYLSLQIECFRCHFRKFSLSKLMDISCKQFLAFNAPYLGNIPSHAHSTSRFKVYARNYAISHKLPSWMAMLPIQPLGYLCAMESMAGAHPGFSLEPLFAYLSDLRQKQQSKISVHMRENSQL